MVRADFLLRLMLAAILTILPLAAAHAGNLPTQLRIDHALRIAHQRITIDYVETNGTVTARVRTRHSDAAGIPQIDKTHSLTPGQAQKLRQLFSALDLPDLRSSPHDLGLKGTDGSNWILSYRNSAGEIESIKMWSPDLKNEERGLTDYVALFRFALDAAGFDPDTTLPRAP